jgi:type I restriction enzyme M protein
MLNQETKRHIDNARQILVGVVPNPSSQIDQITNALIYKFMDDMDEASINAGGDAVFFVGDLEKYSWGKLMDSKVTNQERLNLYSEALTKFSQSAQLPELFRSIFKSAFLPHRSPEVLDLFLKEIKYFDYSNSEELGNAYEYLLSIMSSQGDAGQFRTPRHIIDFIVEATNPSKDDRILDPACGTAGFLISSYKHILKQHDGIDDPEKKEKPLTPQEKQKLMQNFHGYDIDPTMERIAAVNMYLHQFKNPKIFQYDALSSDEKWSEKFDIILANPPFMSPKGGIKPHSKFSVPSNRSEVLFVDYIMNHLRPEGRAGIIVPEGIIFQSGNSYKTLRKNLIDGGLYAVVSLPSGVFQPYSGVKTSILLLNKKLAKQSSELLFIKIENDGFDLGAQRRSSAKNDLPQALEILQKWQIGEKLENKLASFVEKEQIAENGDYNLSGDRYRVATDYSGAKWPMVELGDGKHFTIESGGTPDSKNEEYWNGDINWTTLADLPADNHITEINSTKRRITVSGLKNSSAKLLPINSVLVSSRATIGRIATNSVELATNQGFKNVVIKDSNSVNYKYVALALTNKIDEMIGMANGGTFAEISKSSFSKIKIPLPPLEIQEQIVRELNGYQSIIQGAKQITQNWKPKITPDPSWELVKLGEVCEIFGGGTPSRSEESYWGGNMPWISSKYFSDDHKILGSEAITEEGLKNSSSKIAPKGSTILITRVSVGKFAIADKDYAINQDLTALVCKNKNLDQRFLYLISEMLAEKIKENATGIGVVGVTRDFIVNQKIPLPPIKTQKQIVEEIEAERALVESAKRLIEIHEQKTKATINKLWEE